MDCGSGMRLTDRFAAYVDELTTMVGHADRAGPLRDYGFWRRKGVAAWSRWRR